VSRRIRHPYLVNDIYLLTIMPRFLLVSLNIDAILGEVTIRQRRKKLDEMTQGKGLSDAYAATLLRLKAQKGYKSVLGLKVLMWVLYSERPLQAGELCHALGVEIGSADLDLENVPALRILVASCLGLVTVEASSSRVRLVHSTLQEHLLRDLTLFQSPHSAIAEVCLTYLNFKSVRDLAPTFHSPPSEMPFLSYASLSWGNHTRIGTTENVKVLALRLLDGFDKHISAHLLLLHYHHMILEEPYYHGGVGPKGFTGLHGVAFLGIVEIAAAVLDMKEWDVNATDCIGSTALTWAAIRGHDAVVKMLLERGDVNPNQVDTEYGQTPLWRAALGGYDGVVKRLLEREDVDPERPDTRYGRTLISWAAGRGYEGLVKILLGRDDVDPNQVDIKYGRTPMSWAAENGHQGVVKTLLECQDANPNQADTKSGRTPLLWAAGNGYEGVVKMLLEREDINPDKVDSKYGLVPLLLASKNGHSGVVKMFFERNRVSTAALDNSQTQISSQGNTGVAKNTPN